MSSSERILEVLPEVVGGPARVPHLGRGRDPLGHLVLTTQRLCHLREMSAGPAYPPHQLAKDLTSRENVQICLWSVQDVRVRGRHGRTLEVTYRHRGQVRVARFRRHQDAPMDDWIELVSTALVRLGIRLARAA